MLMFVRKKCLHLCHQLRCVDLPQIGSISNLQQNVKDNQSSNKRSIACSIIPFEDIGVAPISKDKGTRRHGWGIQ